ncbi:unnamed protein product [Paramecium sonneborni]|uniref:Uncharacterized protein n=1 Tax=Paramecium sonneborni TaxID=65129 RepID=A0A8S1QLK9_9CILI|nr:unnamed protein product [Paramecium sonneborni]
MLQSIPPGYEDATKAVKTSPAPLPKAKRVTPAIISEISKRTFTASNEGIKYSFITSLIPLQTKQPTKPDTIKVVQFLLLFYHY